MASSSNAGLEQDRGAQRHGQPGTPVEQLFKKMHSPPPQFDDAERKKMKMAGAGFFGPTRLAFAEEEEDDAMTHQTVPSTPPRAGATSVPSGTTINVGLDQLSALLDQKLDPMQKSMAGLERQMGELSISVDERLRKMESRMDSSDVRIEKLEVLVAKGPPHGAASVFADQLKALQEEVARLRYSGTATAGAESDMELTMVLGGLESLSDVDEAWQWIADHMWTMHGPPPTEVYCKGDFSGMVFARFESTADRDRAVNLMNRRRRREGGNNIWAKPDEPVDIRVPTSFMRGLRWILAEEGYTKKDYYICPETLTFEAGGAKVLKAGVKDGILDLEWLDPAWKEWHALQNSEGFRKLLQQAQTKLTNTSKGKGKSKGKSE